MAGFVRIGGWGAGGVAVGAARWASNFEEIVASDRVGEGSLFADAGRLTFGADGVLWAILDARGDGGGFDIGTVDYLATENENVFSF